MTPVTLRNGVVMTRVDSSHTFYQMNQLDSQ